MQSNHLAPIFLLFLIAAPAFFAYPCQAQIIEYDWIADIEDYAYAVDLNTTAEIVVCVLPSLHGHEVMDSSGKEITDIVQLGVKILNDEPLEVLDGEQTGIGKSGKDNGVLVLVALEERQWRIEVGYGLEGYITDVEANLIAQEFLVPAFQQGNYGEGLYYTVIALGEQIPPQTQTNNLPARGIYYYESTDEPVQTEPPFWDYYFYGMPLWLIIVLVVLGIFVPVLGGGKIGGGRSGGGGAGGRW
ncbi:MAG: TPM domain-containing protein [Candidatus Bathyarchaeia archaeon]